MPPLLEYARRPKRTWNDWWADFVKFTADIVMLLSLTFLAMVAAMPLLKEHYGIRPSTTEHFWKVIYNGWGSIVDHQGDNTIYVWRGRDTALYFSVNTRAAEAAGDAGAQAYVETLIRYVGEVSGNSATYAASLRLLTGQDFQTDTAWHAWAADHLKEVKGGEVVYRELITMQSMAAHTMPYAAALQPGEYDYRNPLYVESRWQEIYQTEVQGFWRLPWHLFELAMVLLYPVTLVVLTLRFARQRRMKKLARLGVA